MTTSLKFDRALLAGVLGTGAMTLLMYGWPLIGFPRMDIVALLGSVFPFHVSPYLVGALIHLGIGISSGLAYAFLFEPWLPGPSWLRGALFSLIPWIFAITLLGPILQTVNEFFRGREAVAANSNAVSNPCAVRPVNPCAAVQTNPCSVGAGNPCASNRNPCAAANPCGTAASAASGGVSPQAMSLMAHLLFGVVLGVAYKPSGG